MAILDRERDVVGELGLRDELLGLPQPAVERLGRISVRLYLLPPLRPRVLVPLRLAEHRHIIRFGQ
jgi:hypothetical protein